MGDLVQDASEAATRVAEALLSSGYVADFSPASLGEIDRFFDEQSRDGRPRPGRLLADDTGRRLFALGAYVGEVLLHELGGAWRADASAPDSEEGLMVVFPDGSVVWPVQRVLKRYVEGPENGLTAYGVALGIALPTDVSSEGTATLVSRSCTTGRLDWVHGELWLGDDAIMRSRLSLAQTIAHAGGSSTVAAPLSRVPVPPRLTPERLAAGHRTNRYIPFAGISRATLHRGRLNDRLDVTMDSGVRYTLLWLGADPAFGILREALARSLHERLTVD